MGEIGRAMLKAGLATKEQLEKAEQEKRMDDIKKKFADIGKRFPNAPDFFKMLVYIAEENKQI